MSHALLECRYLANPLPSITWITPERHVFHWNPEPAIEDIFHKHPPSHDANGYPLRGNPPRILVLENGTLFIQNVSRNDCGKYICLATNPVSNVTDQVYLHLDTTNYEQIKIISVFVGIQAAAAFLILTLIVQLVRWILRKLGCSFTCCSFCRRQTVPNKARQLYAMLENIEHYKSQQLERLRENYSQQVASIFHFRFFTPFHMLQNFFLCLLGATN